MTRFNSRAIVTARMPVGESDCLVDFLTPLRGRVSAMVKGAFRSQRRFMGGFEPPQIMDAGFMTTPAAERVLVEHADIIKPFSSLRKNPLRLARAAIILETALLTVPAYEFAKPAYQLAETGLGLLGNDPDNDRWPLVCSFRLLSLAGLSPELERCVGCGREPGKRPALFCPAEGGLVCRRCREKGIFSQDAKKLSVDTIRTLCAIMQAPRNKLSRFHFTRRTMSQAMDVLFFFTAHQLGNHLRSIEFMRKIKPC